MIKNIFISLKKRYYRQKALKNIQEYLQPISINDKCSFNNNTYLGSNANFNGMQVVGKGNLVIGDNFHSGPDCLIITEIHNYDHGRAIPYDDTYITKNVEIEDNVWVGSRVIILGGVEIHEGAIIQAGAVVVNDIPKYGIAGGNPANVFKYRNEEHYEKLKKLNKVH